jgi:Spy/CpxP family protein refolding chaperone
VNKNEQTQFIKEEKMKKGLTVFVIFSVIVLFSVSSFAQPFQGRRVGKKMVDRSPVKIHLLLKAKQEELNITDDQLNKIDDLVYAFKEKKINARSEGDLHRLEIKKILSDRENLDYNKIKEALSKASASRNEMFIAGLKLRDDIRNVLTPEQQEALKTLAKERVKAGRRFTRGAKRNYQRGNRSTPFRRSRPPIKR